MKRIVACVLLTTVLQITTSATLERSKRWVNNPDYAMAPGFAMRLDDPRRQKMTETFTDNAQGLTVIKDPSRNIRACFITDLDPEFELNMEEKMDIAANQEPFIINSPVKYREFQNRAGPMIFKLCSRLHIFWLNEQLPGPLPLKPLNLPNNIKAPPSLVKAPPSLVKSPPSLMKTPPPLVKAPPSNIRTPPPLHLANHNVVDNVAAPHHVMRIPPPLHLARHNEVETVVAPGALKVPPPLNHVVKTPPPLPHAMKTPPPLHKEIRAPPPL